MDSGPSLAPIIAVKLPDVYDSSVPISVYLAVACTITLAAVRVSRETLGLDLADRDLADRDLADRDLADRDHLAQLEATKAGGA